MNPGALAASSLFASANGSELPHTPRDPIWGRRIFSYLDNFWVFFTPNQGIPRLGASVVDNEEVRRAPLGGGAVSAARSALWQEDQPSPLQGCSAPGRIVRWSHSLPVTCVAVGRRISDTHWRAGWLLARVLACGISYRVRALAPKSCRRYSLACITTVAPSGVESWDGGRGAYPPSLVQIPSLWDLIDIQVEGWPRYGLKPEPACSAVRASASSPAGR